MSGPRGIGELTKQGELFSTQFGQIFLIERNTLENCCTRGLYKLSVCGWFLSVAVLLASSTPNWVVGGRGDGVGKGVLVVHACCGVFRHAFTWPPNIC